MEKGKVAVEGVKVKLKYIKKTPTTSTLSKTRLLGISGFVVYLTCLCTVIGNWSSQRECEKMEEHTNFIKEAQCNKI